MSNMTDFLEDEMIAGILRSKNLTVSAWAASTAYSKGDVVRPSTWNDRFFEAVVAGTSAGSEPSWQTNLGDETTDNTVTWQAVSLGLLKRGLYVALFTAAPGETGGGTEVSGGSYARVEYDPSDSNWDAATSGDGLSDNALDVTFPAPTANWGLVSDMAIFNRASGGDMLIYDTLTTSKTVNNGDPAPKFTAGDLDLQFA